MSTCTDPTHNHGEHSHTATPAAEEPVIQVKMHDTPNPDSKKYVFAGRNLLPGGSANFTDVAEATVNSPMAKRLFTVTGVKGVFIGHNFITLSRESAVEWSTLNASLAPVLEAFFDSGEPVLNSMAKADIPLLDDMDTSSEINQKIKALVDEKVRPSVAEHGGDIVFRGFKDGIVYLEMHGACGSCPSSTYTLKEGVESMLRYHCDEVKEVRAL
ncbi:MAG: NifU family protein [Alphaproteobacteria bacterium]